MCLWNLHGVVKWVQRRRVENACPAEIGRNCMFARRSKIHMGSQIVAETPLLLPSFSSKGFPQVAKIMKLMGEFITGPILVSGYDIYYKAVPQKITFSELIFLDSGGYEARCEHDLSETYGKLHKPKPWNRRFHESALKNWSSKWPTIAVTYDSPTQFQKFGGQVKAAKEFKTNHPNFLWELLLKPVTKKDEFIGLEKVLGHVHQLREFAVVGMTEKEIDASLFGAMKKIARLRAAMDAADVHTPIHIFGSLDPLTSVLYFIAGAEIFDGLTWLRFGYHEGRTMYSQIMLRCTILRVFAGRMQTSLTKCGRTTTTTWRNFGPKW